MCYWRVCYERMCYHTDGSASLSWLIRWMNALKSDSGCGKSLLREG